MFIAWLLLGYPFNAQAAIIPPYSLNHLPPATPSLLFTSRMAASEMTGTAMMGTTMGRATLFTPAASQTFTPPILAQRDSPLAEQLPTISAGEGWLDQQHNQRLAAWAWRQLQGDAPLMRDPWLQQSPEQLVWQMNAVAHLNAPFGLAIIQANEVNAFAMPGAIIGLNAGLIRQAGNVDEFASVIAHEIAHLSQRHFEHRSEQKSKQLLMQLGAIAATVAAAKTGEGNAGAAVMMGSQAMAANSLAQFSREQEREADRIGMQLMAQAGYNVNAMPSFFAMLNQQYPVAKSSFLPSFILSHPLTSERLSEARNRAASFANNKAASHASLQADPRQALFDQIQWRTAYLAKMTNQAELRQAAATSSGAALALADYAIDRHDFAQAHRVLAPFLQSVNQLDPLPVVLAAKLEQAEGNLDAAIARLQALSAVLPERHDLKLYLADHYLQTGKPEAASKVLALLQPLSRDEPHNPLVWQKLSQAAQQLAKNQTGNDQIRQQINVLRYRAKAELWQNQLPKAATSLTQAQKLANQLAANSTPASPQSASALQAILKAQLDEVQQARQDAP